MKFQYYLNDAEKPKPVGYIGFDKFLDTIYNPKKDTKELLIKISEATQKGDMKLKSELKKHLYGFTPCVNVSNRRAYDSITSFTGLAVLDFDKIDNAKEFKQFIFDTYSSIIACWISPSLKGVKAFIKIPIAKDIDEYKAYFYGIASEMQKYNGFDRTTQNAVLLLFIGYDKDILIRKDYTTWDIKGIKLNEFDKTKVIPIPDIKPTDKQGEWVIKWITDKIISVNDNGHPQVRDNCVSLGGYVASGYIEYYNAISLVNSLISQNSYLQKGIAGYQKTAQQSINLGMSKPLKFD